MDKKTKQVTNKLNPSTLALQLELKDFPEYSIGRRVYIIRDFEILSKTITNVRLDTRFDTPTKELRVFLDRVVHKGSVYFTQNEAIKALIKKHEETISKLERLILDNGEEKPNFSKQQISNYSTSESEQ